MSKMRYVNTRIWDDEWFADLDPQSKFVFVYLLTNALTEISGAYEIRSRRIAFDTGLDEATIRSILDRFEQDGKIIYRDGWLLIVNFIRHQALNPKVKVGIERSLEECPSWIRERLSLEGYESLLHLNPNLNLNSNQTQGECEAEARESAPKPPPQPPPETRAESIYREYFPDVRLAIGQADAFRLIEDLDEEVWRATCDLWKGNGYNARHVGNIADRYRRELGHKASDEPRGNQAVLDEAADYYQKWQRTGVQPGQRNRKKSDDEIIVESGEWLAEYEREYNARNGAGDPEPSNDAEYAAAEGVVPGNAPIVEEQVPAVEPDPPVAERINILQWRQSGRNGL